MMADRTLSPGWYTYEIDSLKLADWEAFRRAHRDVLRQRKTIDRSRAEQSIAMLLELTAPLDWSFPGGLPLRAPKGAATTLQEGEPEMSPSWPVQIEQMGSAVASTAGASSRLIYFSLGAVALIALLRRKR